MTGDDAQQAALDVIKFDFIDARETPEVGGDTRRGGRRTALARATNGRSLILAR